MTTLRSPPLPRLAFLAFILLMGGCASGEKVAIPDGELYNQALAAIEQKDYRKAINALEQLERDHPYSELSSQTLLLSGYAHYKDQDYSTAIIKLDLYGSLYPASSSTDYALYLRSLCFFEQIEDPDHDPHFTLEAKTGFERLIRRYPGSKYAKDARLRYDSVLENQATHEMNVGRFYQHRKYYGAAILRYQTVIIHYNRTVLVPEAIYRLAESYLSLGIYGEANDARNVLTRNYPDNPWTEKAGKLVAKHGRPDADAG